jgi:hypothetical protein
VTLKQLYDVTKIIKVARPESPEIADDKMAQALLNISLIRIFKIWNTSNGGQNSARLADCLGGYLSF